MIALLSVLATAFAIDVNDQVSLELAGGEQIDGWFVRARPDIVTLHVPTLNRSVEIDISLVAKVEVNGSVAGLETFTEELQAWHLNWINWIETTPTPPPPLAVALASVPLAGSGHAWLGDWQAASGMMVADALGMTVAGWELQNKQRLNVVTGALAVSVVMKFYAATNGVRKARNARRKRGEGTSR